MLLVAAIVVVGALAALLVFGDSPSLRGLSVHRLRVAALRGGDFLERWFNRIDSLTNGCLVRAVRWLIPAFYTCVITLCFYLFFDRLYYKMPMGILTSPAHITYIHLTIALVYISMALATFSDPGYIDRHNVSWANSHFVNNGLIFFGFRDCSTCKLEKPARSKHCSTCGHCIMMFDHHCVWINNCVGYYNFRWFMAYLAANINLLVYGGYISFRTLEYNNTQSISYWRLMHTDDDMKVAGVFVILCVIFVFIAGSFTALHVRYLYLGVTTNEADKWGDIEYLVGIGALYWVPDLGVYVEQAHENGEPVYLNLSLELVVFREGEREVTRVASIEDIDNIYDSGFLNNVRSRLFPA